MNKKEKSEENISVRHVSIQNISCTGNSLFADMLFILGHMGKFCCDPV